MRNIGNQHVVGGPLYGRNNMGYLETTFQEGPLGARVSSAVKVLAEELKRCKQPIGPAGAKTEKHTKTYNFQTESEKLIK